MRNSIKKNLAAVLGLGISAFGFSTFAEEQTLCPMMIEDEIDTEEVVEYEGKKIYMCCGTCSKLWAEAPDYYFRVGFELGLIPQFSELPEKAKEVELLAQRFCPLRPDSVVGPNSPSIEYQGKTIYFFKERDIARKWKRDEEGSFAKAREAGLLPQFDEEKAAGGGAGNAEEEADADAAEATEITVTADKIQLAYDKTEIEVKAGAKIKLTLVNPEGGTQPHNILILAPGKVNEVGALANAGMTKPGFMQNPVPESEHILHASKLLQPGSEDVLEFDAPAEAGDYPYICTFPGHWMLMKGVMKVVE